MNYKGKINHI